MGWAPKGNKPTPESSGNGERRRLKTPFTALCEPISPVMVESSSITVVKQPLDTPQQPSGYWESRCGYVFAPPVILTLGFLLYKCKKPRTDHVYRHQVVPIRT